jgi:hypothetical protein
MAEELIKAAGKVPTWLLLGVVAAVPMLLIVLDVLYPTDFVYVIFGIPSLLIVWLAAAVWSGAKYVALKRADRPRVSVALAAALPVVAIFTPLPLVRGCDYLGDVLLFVSRHQDYARQVAALPRSDHPRIAVFNWGGMIWASSGVVYDESDQVALPKGRQSAEWLANHTGQNSPATTACGLCGGTIISRASAAELFPTSGRDGTGCSYHVSDRRVCTRPLQLAAR